jgi:hypothetical protein
VVQGVEHLPSKCDTLSSNPCTWKKTKKKKNLPYLDLDLEYELFGKTLNWLQNSPSKLKDLSLNQYQKPKQKPRKHLTIPFIPWKYRLV